MIDERFTKFYQAYPRKKSPGQALRTWQKLSKNKDVNLDIVVILKAIDDQKKEWMARYGSLKSSFIPYPSTWLNALSWMNEIDYEADAGVTKKTAADRAREAADNLAHGFAAAENYFNDGSVVATIH